MRVSTACASAVAQLSSRRLGAWSARRPSFAAYSSSSAWRCSSSLSVPSVGKQAMPSELGARSASTRLMRPTSVSASGRAAPGISIANSSPPRRPTESIGRRFSWSWSTVQRSSSSPAACPSLSFTALKLSRSSSDERERAPGAAGLVDLGLEALEEAAPVQAAGQRVGARDPVQLVALRVADPRLVRADERRDAEADGEEGERQVVAAAHIDRDHQVDEQLEGADGQHEHRRDTSARPPRAG